MSVSPVILVPGIKGTKLVNKNSLDHDIIWSEMQSKYESIYDLALQDNPEYEVEQNSIIGVDGVEELAYRNAFLSLARKLKIRCRPVYPVYLFSYDWRKSCVENGNKLLKFVNQLKDKLNYDCKPEDKVNSFNFVTHSMGGLVFSCFLKQLGHDCSMVERAVLNAPPFLGSIDTLVAMIIGEGGAEFNLFNYVIKIPLLNHNADFRKICRTFPSIFELLPVYKGAVEDETGTDYTTKQPGDALPMIFTPKYWQQNIADSEYLKDKQGVEDKERLIKTFRVNLERAGRFRMDKKLWDLNSVEPELAWRLLVICGTGKQTNQRVIVREKDPDLKVKNYFDLKETQDKDIKKQGKGYHDQNGDGRVPLISAACYRKRILTLSVDDSPHALFLNDNLVQSLINRFINKDDTAPDWFKKIGGRVKNLSEE
jgi:hypothetical protein